MGRLQVFILIMASVFLALFLYVHSPKNMFLGANPISEFASNFSDREVKILAVGDVMLGRSVMTRSLKMNSPTYPFTKVAERLKKPDLTIGNLENPIIDKCPFSDSGFKFCADPKMLEGLTYSGVDIVSIANNHTLNYGKEGFEQTKKYLEKAGIDYVGDGNLIVRNLDGAKYGFVGFNFIDKKISESELNFIQDSKSKVDFLIAIVHWGVEYKGIAGSEQRVVAKQLVDAGTDLILGAHPHWIQNIEHINGKPIYYSLGNFVFDQMWSEKTKTGMVAEFSFLNGKLISESQSRVYMSSFAQPEFVE